MLKMLMVVLLVVGRYNLYLSTHVGQHMCRVSVTVLVRLEPHSAGFEVVKVSVVLAATV